MQIGPVVPAQNLNHFLTGRSSFKSRLSPLNPLNQPSSNTLNAQLLRSTDQTRQHLSNLDELLPAKNFHPSPSQADPVLPESVNGLKENRGKGMLEKLNLTRIWEMKTDEDDIMSPEHFSRFQRLLSKCSEYSPRNNLGLRWQLYHGCDNWAGLLDPLDENLRREVVRYGEFVQAAYHGFCSKSAMSADGAPPLGHVALPDKSYKVTKSLYATSSVGLPGWIEDVAANNTWLTQKSSRIGYVAICDDKMEIQRMGRRDIVVALRGTITCLEWTENMRNMLVQLPDENSQSKFNEDNQNIGQPKVECGFLSLYKTHGTNVPSLSESVVKEVQRLIELYKGESLSITVTGHSLGAALALLVADEVSTCAPVRPPVTVFSFGSPRVGNRSFADRVNSNGVKVLRIVNDQDAITKVPGMFVNEKLDQKLRESGNVDKVLNILDNMPWAYSHVGTELRINMKMSPYLKSNADPACCHDLEAYLHLLDGFLASNCPFRVDAKRSLAKLLIEQRSNIKRLYTIKVDSQASNSKRYGHQSMSS